MEDIIIRIGSIRDRVKPERYRAVTELVNSLEKDKFSVIIAAHEPIPVTMRAGVPWEQVGIFVGAGVGTTLINAVVTDIYNSAKKWARVEFGKKSYKRPERVVIYDPSGKVLIVWRIDSQGEREEDYRFIEEKTTEIRRGPKRSPKQ